ncbi:hypothetical protein [Rhizobium sp. BE258]|jgi:hypothetical protein|uniref:hypothetical protein n=1 Tax=unclassified Rhizobium TaxID=2613769 RepID=UPI000DD6BFA3|nr:hypothetical protein [Rhizobium sp. BE258]MDR7144909.1 hypothetical protein [Rhizobium sp. BE258]
MIKEQLAQAKFSLAQEEVALCERVFDRLCASKQIVLEMRQKELANKIIWAFRHGVKAEEDLTKLLT